MAEASNDPGCALVSVNHVLEINGHSAFTAAEVQRAHADATSAITTDASQVRTAKEASAYIGNPEDGGAMSQAHVLRLFLNRFGEGKFEFKRVDKEVLASRPAAAASNTHFIVTGVLERKPQNLKNCDIEYIYGTRTEQSDNQETNQAFMHTIYVSPGKDFFVCKNKREDALRDGQPVYRRLPIAWLRLKEKGNAKRGGYMRYIYRCFAIQIQPAAAAVPTGAAEAQPAPDAARR